VTQRLVDSAGRVIGPGTESGLDAAVSQCDSAKVYDMKGFTRVLVKSTRKGPQSTRLLACSQNE